MNKFYMFDNQKGASLLFAVMILSIVLSIGLGMSVLFVRQVKGIGNIGHSVKALYAADAGIERVLMLDPPVSTSSNILGGLSYDVTVETGGSGDCNADNYCITSIGRYHKESTTTRALEIDY